MMMMMMMIMMVVDNATDAMQAYHLSDLSAIAARSRKYV
jgi:hypothetical protein